MAKVGGVGGWWQVVMRWNGRGRRCWRTVVGGDAKEWQRIGGVGGWRCVEAVDDDGGCW